MGRRRESRGGGDFMKERGEGGAAAVCRVPQIWAHGKGFLPLSSFALVPSAPARPPLPRPPFKKKTGSHPFRRLALPPSFARRRLAPVLPRVLARGFLFRTPPLAPRRARSSAHRRARRPPPAAGLRRPGRIRAVPALAPSSPGRRPRRRSVPCGSTPARLPIRIPGFAPSRPPERRSTSSRRSVPGSALPSLPGRCLPIPDGGTVFTHSLN
ncbi:hypothetical protein PVAP13_6KG218806 [Panicum virgatum]|uniref:Uncharacterized protein n=1 Tax=Panicum virgatum TaxID=38727 RepID=A0A8T0RF35_PANVG|nr:hypothetical protein PVAP13_6KG218806 [Panicum virgatum]